MSRSYVQKSDDRRLISLVIPICNEEGNIYPFYERASLVLNQLGLSYEMIFVNDGSSDNTLIEVIELHNKDNRVKGVDFSRNFGKEAALTAGIDHASGDVVIEIDADLEHPPEVIIELVEKWREGYDIVFAARRDRAAEPPLKRILAKIFYYLFGRLTKINNHNKLEDLCLLDRRVVEELRQFPEHNRFMKGLIAWTGFKQGFVSYELGSRRKGATKWNYWRLWNFALQGITSFSSAPLKLWTYMGLLIASLSFLYALTVVIRTIIYGIDVPGYASLITVMLFMGGVQLISLGVLGEYVGRIYNEVKNRPLYLVGRLIGFDDNDKHRRKESPSVTRSRISSRSNGDAISNSDRRSSETI